MYHYAGNNPVKYTDPDGNASVYSYKRDDGQYGIYSDCEALGKGGKTISKVDSSINPNIAKTFGKVEKFAGNIGTVLTLYDIGNQLSSTKTVGFNTLLCRLFGDSIVSDSSEHVAALYDYASSGLKELIDNGDVSFTVDMVGGITSCSYNANEVNNLKKEIQDWNEWMLNHGL